MIAILVLALVSDALMDAVGPLGYGLTAAAVLGLVWVKESPHHRANSGRGKGEKTIARTSHKNFTTAKRRKAS